MSKSRITVAEGRPDVGWVREFDEIVAIASISVLLGRLHREVDASRCLALQRVLAAELTGLRKLVACRRRKRAKLAALLAERRVIRTKLDPGQLAESRLGQPSTAKGAKVTRLSRPEDATFNRQCGGPRQRRAPVDRFVVRQNIDHFIELLRVEVVPETRHSLNSLLIEEEDKLARDLEHLEFAESRAAKLRAQYNHMARIRDSLPDGSDQRGTADRILLTFQVTLTLADGACERIKQQIDQAPL